MTGMGHEDEFLPPKLSARSLIGKQTVAATRGNGRDAPIHAIREAPIQPLECDPASSFAPVGETGGPCPAFRHRAPHRIFSEDPV